MKVETVDGVASGVDCFRPKPIRSLVFIKHEFSSPYTPQQNGVVERKNRTLLDMARTMLDALLLKEPFDLRVLELRPVVASYFLDP